jgi:hypothetical protein
VSGLDLKSAQRFCCIQLFVLAFWKLEESMYLLCNCFCLMSLFNPVIGMKWTQCLYLILYSCNWNKVDVFPMFVYPMSLLYLFLSAH